MDNNYVNIYFSYKCSRLLKYGMVIFDSTDEFLVNCLKVFINIYINSKYYLEFETVDGYTYNFDILREELYGKKEELLEELNDMEFSLSNSEYSNNRKNLIAAVKVTLFIAKIDDLYFPSSDDIFQVIGSLVLEDDFVKKLLGDRVRKLSSLVNETYNKLKKFFYSDKEYFKLDYVLFKKHNDIVQVQLNYDIPTLQNNYKRSLIDKCFASEKIICSKCNILVTKFVKQLLRDLYEKKKLYDKYFIYIPSELFDNKDDVIRLLEILNNPLIKRYIVIMVNHNNFMNSTLVFRKYNFTYACVQDFTHIFDINSKLTDIDTNYNYKYIIVSDYKDDDVDLFKKFEGVKVLDILYMKDV